MIFQEGLQIPEISSLYDEAIKEMEINPDLAAAAIDLAGIIQRFNLPAGFMIISHPYKKYSVQFRAFELGIPFTDIR